MLYLLLIASIAFWNASFFGNTLTSWLIIPALVAWVWLYVFMARHPMRCHRMAAWKVFVIGGMWGGSCLAPQFWWLIRGSYLYPNAWGLCSGFIFFGLFMILFSVTHGVFTLGAVYACRYVNRLARVPICVLAIAGYFFYLANFCFMPLGEVKGYPFFWPFLPLGKSKTFLNTLAKIRHSASNKHRYERLEKIKFFQIPRQLHPASDAPKSSYFASEYIRRGISKAARELPDDSIAIFVTPESAFPHPIEREERFTKHWRTFIPKNCHLVVSGQREIKDAPEKPLDILKAWISGDATPIVTNNCQTSAWFTRDGLVAFFDKQILCPFTEFGMREGKPHEMRSVTVGDIRFIPIICYDFFSQITWLSTLGDDEVPIVQTQEGWFPYQTYELIHNFAYVVSIWYDKPIVYVSTTRIDTWNGDECGDLYCNKSGNVKPYWSVIDLVTTLSPDTRIKPL